MAVVSKHVLIVDDSSAIRRCLREALTARKWQICGEAVNGQDAIEKARRLKPDLVVLDLSMPVMNGLQAARELKSLLPAVPLVMFTSFETPHLKQEALDAGITRVVSKSEPVQMLIDSVQSLLEPA